VRAIIVGSFFMRVPPSQAILAHYNREFKMGERALHASFEWQQFTKLKKKTLRAAASANFARRTPLHPRTHRSTTATAIPALPKMDLQRAAA
jgi:hypothetical protein